MSQISAFSYSDPSCVLKSASLQLQLPHLSYILPLYIIRSFCCAVLWFQAVLVGCLLVLIKTEALQQMSFSSSHRLFLVSAASQFSHSDWTWLRGQLLLQEVWKRDMSPFNVGRRHFLSCRFWSRDTETPSCDFFSGYQEKSEFWNILMFMFIFSFTCMMMWILYDTKKNCFSKALSSNLVSVHFCGAFTLTK